MRACPAILVVSSHTAKDALAHLLQPDPPSHRLHRHLSIPASMKPYAFVPALYTPFHQRSFLASPSKSKCITPVRTPTRPSLSASAQPPPDQTPSTSTPTSSSSPSTPTTQTSYTGGSTPSGGPNDDGRGGGGGRGAGGNNGGDSFHNDHSDHHNRLPEDLQLALAYGSLSPEALTRYLNALKNPFLKLLMSIPAYRTRALADSSFLFKLLVQEFIGNGTALASEIAVRAEHLMDELEYVASDLIVGTVVEAAFVWILAPTLSLPASASSSASSLSRYLSSLPSHIFQPSTALTTFTLSQRAASFFYAAAQYTLIGFAAGVVGTAITYGLLEGRKALDPSYKPLRPLPAVLPNSLGWGVFMGVSSNTRFQIVEGIELAIANAFKGTAAPVVKGSIIALRFANNYWGGVQFVQFFRFLGLHATGEDESQHDEQSQEMQQKEG